jgi:hypothetical protein
MPKTGMCLRILLALAVFVTLPVYAREHEQHEAHVHGHAELLVAMDARDLEIEFHSPLMNLAGFEHPPRNASEQQQIMAAGKLLQQAEMLFSLPAEAGCSLQDLDIELPFHEDEADTHTEHTPDIHTDFSGRYRYKCESPAELRQFRVQLFDQFPLIETIQVQVISDHGQHAVELYPGKDIVEL